MSKQIRSAVIIARLLEAEGFSAHTANAVIRYSNRITNHATQHRYERNRRAAKEALRGLDEGTKAIVGRFINHQMRKAFDVGLRIGLTAHAELNSKECEGIPDERRAQQEFQDAAAETPAVKEADFQGRTPTEVAPAEKAETRAAKAIKGIEH